MHGSEPKKIDNEHFNLFHLAFCYQIKRLSLGPILIMYLWFKIKMQ